jgi:hypothetical protein
LKRVDQELGVESVTVDVRNMAFQPRITVRSFGVGSLESNILCSHHNSGLSDLDDEGLAAFEAFEILHYAAAGVRPAPNPVYSVNGDRLERFLLKALCGGLYSGMFPVEEAKRLKDVEPPLGWLDILYLNEPFPDGYGLYCCVRGLGKVLIADRTIIKWAPLLLGTEDCIAIRGLRFWLFGFEFALLAPGPEPRAVEALGALAYRPSGVMIDGAGKPIGFAWGSGAGSGEIGLQLI